MLELFQKTSATFQPDQALPGRPEPMTVTEAHFVSGLSLTDTVPAGMVRGTVLETMNAGAYTYVFIKTDQDERWVAVPKTAVLVNDVVLTEQGMIMNDFESKSLKTE